MAKVAFIGLGVMGYPMAGHLAAGGHEVTVYNRTAAKAEAWVAQHGGKAAATPKAAAEGNDYVFSCVGNDEDLRSVILGDEGALAGMAEGSCLIDNTTASADVARELSAIARGNGVAFIDAPVSGGQAGAEKRRADRDVRRRRGSFRGCQAGHRLLRPLGGADGAGRLRAVDQNGQSALYCRSAPGPL